MTLTVDLLTLKVESESRVTWAYLTLPYREDLLLPSAEASNGPNVHPRINRRVTKSQVQYTPGSIPTLGTIPLPNEGLLTWTYLLTCSTLGISKRISAFGSKAHKHINPGHHDQQDSKPGKSRRPISESSIKPQNPPSATLTWVHSKIGITST